MASNPLTGSDYAEEPMDLEDHARQVEVNVKRTYIHYFEDVYQSIHYEGIGFEESDIDYEDLEAKMTDAIKLGYFSIVSAFVHRLIHGNSACLCLGINVYTWVQGYKARQPEQISDTDLELWNTRVVPLLK